MKVVDGCRSVRVEIFKVIGERTFSEEDKKSHVRWMNPIPYGKEKRFGLRDDSERCHDCGVKLGHYHHPGCDWEECPGCGHQMLMCSGECG